MLGVVVGVIITLAAAVMAIFLILIAINIALLVKLRSGIPPSPQARPLPALHRPPGGKDAGR